MERTLRNDLRFRTLIAEIEGVVNDGSLTYAGGDPGTELKALTTNDFLKVELPQQENSSDESEKGITRAAAGL